MQLFCSAAREKGLALEMRLDPGLPEIVAGDGPRLMQILNNLVGNAIKFTQSGTVTLEAMPLQSGSYGRCRILFMVSDSGIGIPDDRLRGLFEPFSQVARGFTRSYQGAGLGLAITRKLVKLLGGTLSVASEEGCGTEIAVGIPLGCVAGTEDRTERIKAVSMRNDLGLRVLLAEDDAVSRFAAARMLQRLGCVVREVENGLAALEALLQEEFDIVLMDIQMPMLDGVQAVRIIRSDPEFLSVSDIPVVALTAYAEDGDMEHFADAGMDMHIAKPVRMENVVEALLRCALVKNLDE
jgi:CheY-like chemotaxis protein